MIYASYNIITKTLREQLLKVSKYKLFIAIKKRTLKTIRYKAQIIFTNEDRIIILKNAPMNLNNYITKCVITVFPVIRMYAVECVMNNTTSKIFVHKKQF